MQTLWTLADIFVVGEPPITGLRVVSHFADRYPQENSACSCTGFRWLGVLVVYQQYRFYHIDRESQKNEELFKIVTENAADMIALVDMKGRRLYNSPAYKRMLGYSSAELGETLSFDQIHPDDRMRVLEAAREARESGVGKRPGYRIKHKDGSWRVLESEASTIRDNEERS